MTRLARLGRTSLYAAQHPVNAVALASGLAGAVALDNPLPLALYTLSYGLSTLALWNWDTFRARFDAEDATVAREQAERNRSELATSLAQQLERFRARGYRVVRPLLADYAVLSRLRDEIAQRAQERSEVNLSSEAEIVGRVDAMLAAYLTLAHRHLVFLSLLSGIRAGSPATSARSLRALPRLEEWLAELDRQRVELAEEIAPLPEGSPTREARESQLKAVEQRRQVFAEAGRNHESVLSQLDAIKLTFAAIVERMAAAELVAADVSGYLETAAAEIDRTLRLAEATRLEVGEAA